MSRLKKDPLRELADAERQELVHLSRSPAAPAAEVARAKALWPRLGSAWRTTPPGARRWRETTRDGDAPPSASTATDRYHDDRLQNLLISASLGGYQSTPTQNP